MFFRFAKNNCCNYSQSGPFGKTHFCWLEPQETNSICLLKEDKPCRWFVEAVLPLDDALQAEWERVKMVKADPNPSPDAYRICLCGKRFKAGSNRQLRCPDCQKANRNESKRNAAKRQRVKQAQSIQLGAL